MYQNILAILSRHFVRKFRMYLKTPTYQMYQNYRTNPMFHWCRMFGRYYQPFHWFHKFGRYYQPFHWFHKFDH